MSDTIVFLQHGLHGYDTDYSNFIKTWKEIDEEKKVLFYPLKKCIGRTHDGINTLGFVSCKEVVETLSSFQGQSMKLIFIGHSLGGIIFREVIKRLYENTKVLDDHKPLAFVTFATPHMGTQNMSNPMRSVLSSCFSKVIGQTGEDLMLRNDTMKKMLEGNYTKALNKFKFFIIYSNIMNDIAVPYCTSSISEHNPYMVKTNENIAIKQNDKYPSIVTLEKGAHFYTQINMIASWRSFSKRTFYPEVDEQLKVDFYSMMQKFRENLTVETLKFDVAIESTDGHSRIISKNENRPDIVKHCVDNIFREDEE